MSTTARPSPLGVCLAPLFAQKRMQKSLAKSMRKIIEKTSQNELQHRAKSGPKTMKNRARKPTAKKTRKYVIFKLRGDPSTLEINGFTKGFHTIP